MRCRDRVRAVNEVTPSSLPPDPGAGTSPHHLLRLSSLEDDGFGDELAVIWELEAATSVIPHQVLFFAEFTHLRRHHAVISGCEFQKLVHGPAPRQLMPVRRRLVDQGDAELVTEDFLSRPQHRLVPKRAADTSVFTDDELKSIDDVLDQLEGMTATQVSELSHEEPGWRLTELGETIPYSTAFLGFPQVPTHTSRRLSREVAARYGLALPG